MESRLTDIVHQIARDQVIAVLTAMATQANPRSDREKVVARMTKLVDQMEHDHALMAASLTNENQRARLDVLIFTFLNWYGWGRTRRYPSGAVVAVDAPVSGMRRLGYPTRARLVEASRRVHQTAPEAAARYKAARKSWLEARQRYLATETEESWRWYICGPGNRSALAYRSQVALKRRGGEEAYRKRHRYLYSELLPRQEERKRARREMGEAAKVLRESEMKIYDAMGVPAVLRRLA